MRSPKNLPLLTRNLADARSKRVVFLSHCLLNQNVRYLGGATRPGSIREVVDPFLDRGVGIYQMPCPEQRVWGGVLKRHCLPLYGSRGTWLYRALPLLRPLFLAYTRWRYRGLARRIARDVADYVRSGYEVVALVGINGSPSCGVCRTLDMARAIDIMAGPVDQLEPREFNNRAIIAGMTDGEGMFIAALRDELRRKDLAIPMQGHDLIAELAFSRASPAARRPAGARGVARSQ